MIKFNILIKKEMKIKNINKYSDFFDDIGRKSFFL